MKNRSFPKSIVLVIYAAFIFLNCNKQEPSVVFPEKQQLVELPFHYSPKGLITTPVIIADDTLSFIIDTGSALTVVAPGRGKPVSRNYMITNTTFDKESRWSATKMDEIDWGELKLKNFICLQHDTSDEVEIIGGDVLRNFCVKIDNSQNKIILAKTVNELDPRGECISFSFRNNTITLKGTIEGRELEFLFDSGFDGEVFCNVSSFCFSDTIEYPQTVWANETMSSPFLKSRNAILDSLAYRLVDFNIGNMKIANTIVSCNRVIKKNLLGTVFIRRFKSITIDYMTSRIWFELPDDNQLIDFSGRQLVPVPLSYLDILYGRVNSFGIQLSDSMPLIIQSMQLSETYRGVELGDTLVGIDKMLFYDTAFDSMMKSANKNHFYVEKSIAKQKEKVFKTFSQKNEANFHFLKSGSLKSLEIKRNKQLVPAPSLAYSFSSKEPSYGFSAINFSGNGTWFHIPWSTLSGKEQTLTVYKNGKEQVLSNVPPKED